ncbi:MAG: Type 1 glutamine amidotransferase-like domain-containing protein [Acidimicrobiales bacterium]
MTSSPEPPTAGDVPGPLALVGGAEWREGCTFDVELWERSGAGEVLVLPTAAAYEHPQRAVEAARSWFERIGAPVRGLMVLGRADAEDPAHTAAVRDARLVYLGGGSPLHLRSVLKDSAVWEALVAAWRSGAVVAGSSAGAMVLGDPMVDPRGGALTLGLGLVPGLAVMPHSDLWSQDKARRTVQLATGDLRIAAVDERTALIREPGGAWRAAGAGGVAFYVEGEERGVDSLAGLGLPARPAA